MSFLCMGNAWWSVAGLVLDVTGFTVLAWDLRPEYRLNRARRALRRLGGIHDFAGGSTHPPSSEQLVEHKVVGSTYKKLAKDFVNAFDGELVKNMFRQMLNDYDEGQIETKELEYLRSAMRGRASDLSHRSRRWLYCAVGAVILGFVFQVWGSIPVKQFSTTPLVIEVVSDLPAPTNHAPAFSTGRIGGT